MASACLLPQDLYRFLNDGGAPDSLCSLFLRFPVTSAFVRYSAVEYFFQLFKVLLLDLFLFKIVASAKSLKVVSRQSAEINFVLHPILFFVTPFFYAQLKINIGFALLSNAILFLIAKWYYMRHFLEAPKRFGWTIPLAALAGAWYSGAILSF